MQPPNMLMHLDRDLELDFIREFATGGESLKGLSVDGRRERIPFGGNDERQQTRRDSQDQQHHRKHHFFVILLNELHGNLILQPWRP